MKRQGFALLVAVVVLAALGVISATGLALGRAERLAGALAVAEVQARGAAESAVAAGLRGWSGALTPVVPGGKATLAEVSTPGPATGRALLRALGGRVYSILGIGERVDGAGRIVAEVRIEVLVTLGPLLPDSSVIPRRYPRGWRLLP